MATKTHIHRDFPLLRQRINGYPLVYLDSSNTSLTPLPVVKAMHDYYHSYRSNIHRAVYPIAEKATVKYEEAREKVRMFIAAKSIREIIFTRNATESINLVAKSWAKNTLQEGDGVVLSIMEHHSNIVPWLMLKEEIGLRIHFVRMTKDYQLDMNELKNILKIEKIKLISLVHESNVLGTINPVQKIIRLAQRHGAKVLIDGAQSAAHRPVDVSSLDVDFYAFTGHKMLGPTGIGVLYVKEEILNAMSPFLGGGDMIREVHETGFTLNDLPYRFEAGTPNIAGAIGLGAAVNYLQNIGMQKIEKGLSPLTQYALRKLSKLPGITIFGPKTLSDRGGIISFTMKGIHPHDVATLLGEKGVCVRAGHHCAQPLMEYLKIPATLRVSLNFYNTKKDIDVLISRLREIKKLFSTP